MWSFLKLFASKRSVDDDHTVGIKAAKELSEIVAPMLTVQIELANIDLDDLSSGQKDFLCGYIAGYCDVLAQGWGGRGGSSLSMTTSARVMEQLFGTKIGSALFEYTDVCMVEESDVFLAGLQTGGIDANGTMKKQLSLGLAHFFRKPETRDR